MINFHTRARIEFMFSEHYKLDVYFPSVILRSESMWCYSTAKVVHRTRDETSWDAGRAHACNCARARKAREARSRTHRSEKQSRDRLSGQGKHRSTRRPNGDRVMIRSSRFVLVHFSVMVNKHGRRTCTARAARRDVPKVRGTHRVETIFRHYISAPCCSRVII